MAVGTDVIADTLTTPAVPELPVYRLSVEQYHQMIRGGILTDDDPLELLEGWLVPKMTKYPPHAVSKGLIADALLALRLPGWFIATKDPITTAESEPEPDVMLVRGTRRDYQSRHPGPADVAFVVEVADTSLARDRTMKKRIYARARIPAYWIVNLLDRRVEVYTDPTGPAETPDYRCREDIGPEGELSVRIDGREAGRVPVGGLLP